MNAEQVTELEMVFRVALRLPDGADLWGIHRALWSDWDSMAQVSLIAAIESQFDLQFDVAAAMQIDSWDTCLSVVTSKLRG